MFTIAIILNFVGFSFLCSLLFALTVHALPLVAAVMAGLAAYRYGSGPIGAIIVGAIAGSFTLIVGQIAFAASRSPLVRAAIACVFAMPAAVAGYHVAYDIASLVGASEGWRQVMAVAGALIVAATAWARMTSSSMCFAPPDAGWGQLPAR